MDVVSEGRNPTSSGTGKRESGAGSEPGGSDKEQSDNDEKVCINSPVLFLMFCYPLICNTGNPHIKKKLWRELCMGQTHPEEYHRYMLKPVGAFMVMGKFPVLQNQ